MSEWARGEWLISQGMTPLTMYVSTPIGRMPFTVYPAAYNDQLRIQDLAMRANQASHYPGRTYKYYVCERSNMERERK